jgi:hypothetical protein
MKTNQKLTSFILNQHQAGMTNSQIADAIFSNPKYNKYSYRQIFTLVVKIITAGR